MLSTPPDVRQVRVRRKFLRERLLTSMSAPSSSTTLPLPQTRLENDAGLERDLEKTPNPSMEAARLHREGLQELQAGRTDEARERFREAIQWRRTAKDPLREASTWHQLARLESKSDNRAAAAEAYRNTLRLAHLSGDKDTEALAFHDVGFLAWKAGKRQTGLLLVAISFTLMPAQEAEAEGHAMRNLAHMAGAMGYGIDQFQTVLTEAVAEYQHDAGNRLVDEALDPASSAPSPFETIS